jgi:hypothetical protein
MIALAAALLLQGTQPPTSWPGGVPPPTGTVVMTPVSAGTFAQGCQRSDDTENDACNMYIWGVADALAANGIICPPTNSWTIIAGRLVKNRLRDHPEALEYHPYFLIRDALVAQYRCRPRR